MSGNAHAVTESEHLQSVKIIVHKSAFKPLFLPEQQYKKRNLELDVVSSIHDNQVPEPS